MYVCVWEHKYYMYITKIDLERDDLVSTYDNFIFTSTSTRIYYSKD